jgi:hypothetical protein
MVEERDMQVVIIDEGRRETHNLRYCGREIDIVREGIAE